MAKLNEGGKIELGGTAGTNSGIAIGGLSEATKQGTVAIGERAKGEFQSVAIGQDAQARWIDDTPNVSGNNIAIGASTRAYAANGIAQGNYATVYGTQGIAIGLQATVGEKPLTEAEYKDKVAKGEISAEEQKSYLKTDEYGETVYRKLDTSGTNIKKDHFRGIAIGSLSQANAADSIALGSGAETYGENSAALGFCAQTRGDYSLAMGIQSKAEKSLSIAIGGLASAGEENSIAIGAKTRVNKSGGVALGAGSIADRDAEKIGYALGGDNSTLEKALEAIGQKEKYDKLSGIVDPLQAEYNTLVNAYMNADSGSTEEAEAKQKLTAWEGGHTEFLAALKEKNNMSASWKSGSGAVSIGDAGNQKTRQLTGLAAGSEDTDAVNVAQLKAVNAKVDQNKTDITEINKKITNLGESSDWTLAVARGDDSKTENEATVEGNSAKVSGGTVTLKAGRGVKLKQDGTNVQIGLKYIDMEPAGGTFNDAKATAGGALAVGQNSVADGHQGTAVGFETHAGDYAFAGGSYANAKGNGSVGIGYNALANGDGSIAIGTSRQKVEGYPDKGWRKVDSENAIAIGAEAVIDNQSEQSTALGVRAEAVKSAGSAALGSFAKVQNSDYSTAVGNGALVRNSQYGTALGNNAVVSGTEGGVALGSHSLATRKSGGVGYNLTNTPWRDLNDYLIMTGQIEAYTKADAALTAAKKELAADPDNYDLQAKVAKATADRNAIYNSWISTNGAVSIGNEATGITRQLTGVAAGTKDTDAVNVAQLKALDNKVTDQLKDAGGVHYFSVTPIDKAQTEDSNYFNGGAKGDGGIAIGESAMSQGRGIAMGQKAKADPNGDTTGNIGAFDGIAIGHRADVRKEGGIALGVGATVERSQKSIDEGYHELGGISIGAGSLSSGDSAIALGANTKAYGSAAMALGDESQAKKSGVAVGSRSSAEEGAIAVGWQAHAKELAATSIGTSSDAVKQATAVGAATTADGKASTAIGLGATSKGVLSTTVGALSRVNGFASSALGYKSVAEEANSIALGAESVANRQAGEIGYIATGNSATFEEALGTLNRKEDYDKWTAKVNESKEEYENLTNAFNDASEDKKDEAKAALDAWKGQHADFIAALTAKQKLEATWKATKAAVSVGADGMDAAGNRIIESRQIINVAAGTRDTDAVNVAQLKALDNKVTDQLKDAGGVHYFSVNSDDKNAPDGTNWNNDGATKRNAIAVGKNSKSTGESTVAVGTDSYAKNNYDLAMGYGANSLGYSGVAVGQRAIAGDSGAVSVGARTGSYGESGVAIGDSAANYGQYGVALGFSAKALDNSATVVGRTSKGISGTTVLGRGSEIYSENTVAIGGNSWVGNKEFIDDFHKYAYSHQGHDAVPRLNEYIKEKFLNDPAQKAAYEAKYADKLNTLPGEPGKMNSAKENYLAELILQEKASADMPASMTLLGSRTDGNVKDGVALGSFANAQRKEGIGGYDFLNSQEITDLEKYLTSVGKMDEYNAAKADFETKKATFKEAEEKGIAAETEAKRLYQEYINASTTQPEKKEEAKQNWEAAEEVRHTLLDKAYDLKKEALAAAAKLKGFGSTWVATHGAVAIGDEEKGFTRQITGLAAGTKDTDAVNVAQLKAVNTKVDQNKTDITNLKKVSGKVINGTNTTVTEGTDIDGKTKTYAVNVAADGQIAENNTGIVTGDTVYKFVNPIKTQVTNMETTVNQLKGGFTIKDTATGTANITLGETTKPSITFKAETKNDDTTGVFTAKVDGEKNVTYTLNTKKLKEEMGLTQGVGNMSSWKLKATGDTNSETIADGNEVEFAVAEENKGLTVKRAGKKIQYGIDANKLIDNINNATTKITNVDGEKIDISNNSSITNINKKITNLAGKATKVTVDGGENSTDGNLKIKKTEKDGQITYDLSLNDELVIGKDGKDGKIGINGKDGTSAEITVGKGEPGVDGKDGITRIIYKDKDNKTHEVATLDDGLKFKGDNDAVVMRKLNTQLNITGGITDAKELSDNNIGVVGTAGDNGGMAVKLSKNLKGLTSAEFKDGDNITNITAGDVTVTRKEGNVSLWELNQTVNNITQGTTDVSSWKLQANGENERIIKKDSVVNFKNGENTEVIVNGNDITVDLNAATKKQINDNTTNISNIDKRVTTIENNIDQKIEGAKITVKGDDKTGVKAEEVKTGDKVTGYKISLDNKVKVGNVTIDGTGEGTDKKGEITGLTNRTLDSDDFATKGRAATEEQLKAAMGKVQAQSRTTVKGSENITVTPKTESASEYTVELAKNINVDSVTAKTVKADEYKVGEKTYINDEGINANGNKITNVGKGEISEKSTDAVNGSQLYSVEQKVTKNITDLQTNIYDMGMKVGELDTRVNKVGAGAAALAALHPLDFDPDAKWDFAAGYGNYKGANAAAVGAYYRPNEDTMISVGGSFGGGENMVNAGIAVKLGQGNHVTNSKVAMAKEMLAMQERMAQMEAQMAKMQGFIGALTGMESASSAMFPDVPENHWAYEYVKGLCEQGVIEGYPDGMFSGNRNLTRYEMAAMLYRALAKGVQLDARAVKEFASELGRIRVDVISQDKEGQPVIERVRVNKK